MDATTIGIICTVLGCIIGILGYNRVMNKDAEADGFTKAKLESIANGVDSIRVDIKTQGEKITSVNERLIRVEESTKSAHKRLDEFEFYKNDKEINRKGGM
ncbi:MULTISPECIES: hypothetical protein [unclassified Clostridium]|uniref:hypothetical protein n=1 Tax=unclassified Clostridium TaxID=2614128 RepID=UPI0002982D85|nr:MULTISPECIES: hypothetical protein [unclassified Clostridium]EKQ56253.1 MAG: hypothetical protein A370_02009 [Clostridium sp. Maddingley MBC34-26]